MLLSSLLLCVADSGIASGALTAAGMTVEEDEDFEAAFKTSDLPWYDAGTEGLKSSTAPNRPGSIVSNRNRIPPLVEKKKGKQVSKPLTPPVGTGGTGTAAGTVGTSFVYVIGIVFAIVLVALLIYGFLKLESDDTGTESNAKKRRQIRDHIKHLPFEIEEQDGDFETFAEKSFRDGDYSKAVIYLFADLLVAMSESGVVRLQRGKTNRQYLNEVWDHGEIRPYYRKVMTAFEDAFFGKHVIERRRAEVCFSERPAFNAALEKIKQQKFAAMQGASMLAQPKVGMEGTS
ncbi:hypothetical protein MFFC18_10680 [Mariniblastus fucicola]|uniref:DUF4129 domain-containing protein n=2 Tax=Mariniblastus fucicola TaxID=980251 RepID=A0A5B9PE40_9BACT|nr:hypothetical protein MFFC18_10680 [Mariniblastus fucicola]